MKKNIIIFISILVVVAVMSLVLVLMSIDKPNTSYCEEEIKFKDEY